MKQPTQEEITNALTVIQNTCKAQGANPCSNCPLSKNDYCVIQEEAPEEWKISTKPPVWKAFD
jgi:hypothetical protein